MAYTYTEADRRRVGELITELVRICGVLMITEVRRLEVGPEGVPRVEVLLRDGRGRRYVDVRGDHVAVQVVLGPKAIWPQEVPT